jgi:hypothetical protein
MTFHDIINAPEASQLDFINNSKDFWNAFDKKMGSFLNVTNSELFTAVVYTIRTLLADFEQQQHTVDNELIKEFSTYSSTQPSTRTKPPLTSKKSTKYGNKQKQQTYASDASTSSTDHVDSQPDKASAPVDPIINKNPILPNPVPPNACTKKGIHPKKDGNHSNNHNRTPPSQQYPGFFPNLGSVEDLTLNPWNTHDQMDTTEHSVTHSESPIESPIEIADASVVTQAFTTQIAVPIIADASQTNSMDCSVNSPQPDTEDEEGKLPSAERIAELNALVNDVPPPDPNDDGFATDSSTTSSVTDRIASFKWKNKYHKKSRAKLRGLRKAATASQHAPPEDDSPTHTTFDAYISPDLIQGQYIDDKISYIDLLMFTYDGYVSTSTQTWNHEKKIMISFSKYGHLIAALRDHQERFPLLKFTIRKYYTWKGHRVSSNDFKLLNVPEMASVTAIKQAIKSIDPRTRFRLNHRDENGTVFFTVLDNDRVYHFAQQYCCVLHNTVVRLAPAYFTEQHFKKRNTWMAKFSGFPVTTQLATVKEVLDSVQTLDVYRRSFHHQDDHVYAVFTDEKSMIKACSTSIRYRNWTIRGCPVHSTWQEWKTLRTSSTPSTYTTQNSELSHDAHVSTTAQDIPMVDAATTTSVVPNNTAPQSTCEPKPVATQDAAPPAPTSTPPVTQKYRKLSKGKNREITQLNKPTPATGSNAVPLGNNASTPATGTNTTPLAKNRQRTRTPEPPASSSMHRLFVHHGIITNNKWNHQALEKLELEATMMSDDMRSKFTNVLSSQGHDVDAEASTSKLV